MIGPHHHNWLRKLQANIYVEDGGRGVNYNKQCPQHPASRNSGAYMMPLNSYFWALVGINGQSSVMVWLVPSAVQARLSGCLCVCCQPPFR